MQVERINVSKLFSLPSDKFEEYHNICQFQKGNNNIKNKTCDGLMSLSWLDVSEIKDYFQSMNVEGIVTALKIVFGLKEKEILHLDIKEFYQAFNWIQDELLKIYKAEKKLSSKPDSKLKEAGIDDLNIFGDLNSLIAIGEKFATPPHEVEKWNYSLVFSLIYHDKISGEVQKRYDKILNKN
jgi:hypothetical protein